MNALAQRRLTPVLATICVLFGVAVVAMLAGVGRAVHWDPAPPAEVARAPEKAAQVTPPKPLATYVDIWQRPLFTADRKPMVPPSGDAQGASLGDLELTGIIMTPGLRMALLHDRTGNREVRVREGAALPDGRWMLGTLSARSATFDSGGEKKELVLKVSAPTPSKPGTAQAPGVPSPMQPPMQPPQPVPMASPPSTAQLASPPPSAEEARQKARIEALKAAVQKRRAEQAAQSANDGVR
jgi:general secretion pathway protein N